MDLNSGVKSIFMACLVQLPHCRATTQWKSFSVAVTDGVWYCCRRCGIRGKRFWSAKADYDLLLIISESFQYTLNFHSFFLFVSKNECIFRNYIHWGRDLLCIVSPPQIPSAPRTGPDQRQKLEFSSEFLSRWQGLKHLSHCSVSHEQEGGIRGRTGTRTLVLW